MWIPFETTNFLSYSQLEQRSLSCFLEIHKLLISFGIYISSQSMHTHISPFRCQTFVRQDTSFLG